MSHFFFTFTIIKTHFTKWDLRIQDFVELIKVEKRIEAVQYARKYLTPLSPSDEELGQVMALLGNNLYGYNSVGLNIPRKHENYTALATLWIF